MIRRLFAFTFLAALILHPAAARATGIRDGDYETRGKYQGILSCSDCPGIWTELTLEDNGPDLGSGHGSFAMSQRYTGGLHRGETVVTTGSWTYVTMDAWQTGGLIKLQSAVQGAKPQYFLCEGGRRLLPASNDGTLGGRDMQQGGLRRVMPPPTPTFGPLTVTDANRTIYARVGDRFSISLLPQPAPGAAPNPRPDFTICKLKTISQSPSIPSPLDVYGRDAFADIAAESTGVATLAFQCRADPGHLITFRFEIQP